MLKMGEKIQEENSNTSYPLSSKNYSMQLNLALKKFAKNLKFY